MNKRYTAEERWDYPGWGTQYEVVGPKVHHENGSSWEVVAETYTKESAELLAELLNQHYGFEPCQHEHDPNAVVLDSYPAIYICKFCRESFSKS